MPSKKDKVYVVRIVMIGPMFAGKSSLCDRFVNSNFNWIYEPTDELRSFRKLVNITQDEDAQQYCLLHIDDLFPTNHPDLLDPERSDEAREKGELFDSILENKRRTAKNNEQDLHREYPIHAYMYIFDLSNKSSLEELESIMDYIHLREEKESGRKRSGAAVKYLIGCKADLDRDRESTNFNKRIDELCKKYTLKPCKLSALENSQVTETFLDLARGAIDRYISFDDKEEEESSRESIVSSGLFSFCGCGGREKLDDEENPEEETGKKCNLF